MLSSNSNGDKEGYDSADDIGDVEIGKHDSKSHISKPQSNEEGFTSTPGSAAQHRKHAAASSQKKSWGKADTSSRNTSKRGTVLFTCFLQSFCSCSMVLANKQLASSYNHLIDGDLNILLVVFQALVAVVSVEICKAMKWVDYPNFEYRTAKIWAPVNLMFCAMLFTGMASLQHNTVPMVTVFKNIANIFITAG